MCGHEELLRRRHSHDSAQAATVAADPVVTASAVVQVQHLAEPNEVDPVRDRSPITAPSEVVPSPLPAEALTLDQAISLCLNNDPKIRAGFEDIHQAHADALTASLKPNPEMAVGGTLLAAEPSDHAAAAGRAVGV